MPTTFELVLEHGEPVAALVPKEITDKQLDLIYCFMPQHAYCQWKLAKRWNINRVLSTDDWASDQLHRKPMFRPRCTIKLSFGS